MSGYPAAVGRIVGITLAAGAVMILAAGGCAASSRLKAVTGEVEFEQEVLKAQQPVVLEFAKGGCPTCAIVEPVLERLQDDYEGRVTFARYVLMTPFFGITSNKLREQYRVAYYPTVVLFIGGQEKKRWVLDSNREHYVKVLTETVGDPAPKEAPQKGGAPADKTREAVAETPPTAGKQ